MNKTILLAATLVSAAIVFHAASSRYEMAVQSDPSLMYRLDRLTGRVDACARSECRGPLTERNTTPVKTSSGGTLEEEYRGIADKIKDARAYGLTDQEIQQWINEEIDKARKAGLSQADIDKQLGKAPPQAKTPSQSSR